MSTYAYYLSYEPPRRLIPWWVWAALGLLLGAGVVAAAVIAYPRAAAMLWTPAPPPPPAWLADIANATNPTADTIYLVDTSGSMLDELPNIRQGLSASIAAKSPASQVRIIAFGDLCADLPLLDAGLAETAVSRIGDGSDSAETADRCTLEQVLDELTTDLTPGPNTELFLFSDGSLPYLMDPQCAGAPRRSAHTLDGQPLWECRAGWQHRPAPIIAEFAAANIKINAIYFQPHPYDWAGQVQLLTTATGGKFVPVR